MKLLKKENIFKYISILFNLFVFVSGITIAIWILIYGYGTPLKYGSLHYEFLEYFTTLSNIYAAIVAGIVLVYLLINVKKDIVLPRWLSVLHLTSTTSLTLTMLTVIFFLGPTQGFDIMYKQDMFLYHLFNPLLVFLYLQKYLHVYLQLF